MLTLPAHPDHDLDWTIKDETETVFHLDFGWTSLDPFNEALLNAHLLAVEEFVKRAPHAKEVVLAKLDENLASLLAHSETLELRLKVSNLPREAFYAQLISDYLHRLASVLPDQMEPVIVVDLRNGFSYAQAVLIFCRRRFEHFKVKFSNYVLPIEGEAPLMVSLPSDETYDYHVMQQVFDSLEGKPYKAIPEELLNEHWEGVDTLLIDPETIGEIGKRMILGFEAAGGCVIRSRGI